MALVVTYRLPVETCALLAPGARGPALQEEVKKALIAGVESKVPISETEVSLEVATERFNMSVSEEIASPIRLKASELNITPRQVCQGILLSMSVRRVESNSSFPSSEFGTILSCLQKAHLGVENRTEQTQFYNYLMDSLSNSAIGLCEAGTGTGKTLAMLAAAKRILDETPETRLAIACPSIMLMEQFALYFQRMAHAHIDMPSLRILVGRREFVSPAEIDRVISAGTLDADVDVESVIKWKQDGGKALESHWFDRPWLAATLAKVAAGFPVAAVTLPDAVEENDPGLLSYQAQFKTNEDDPVHEIILCTHSMLAVDVRRRMFAAGGDESYRGMLKDINSLFGSMSDSDAEDRKATSKTINERKAEALKYGSTLTSDRGILPPFHFLMVDEAHLLEQAFSNALSSYVSLKSFLSGLQDFRAAGGKISAASVKRVSTEIDRLKSLPITDSVSINEWSPTAQTISDILKEICHAASVISSIKSGDDDFLLNRIKKELRLISLACAKNTYSRAYIKFSPVRAFPQLFVGAPSVDNALSFLWSGCRAAACVSATLYLPRSDGFSAAYQAGLMATPKDRMREYSPVVPEWIFSTIEGVYFPESVKMPTGTYWLRPPTRSDKLSEAAQVLAEKSWCKEVAESIERIYESSPGGVLVLMTSYSSIDEVSSLLPTSLAIAMVAANRDTSLATQRKRFLTHSHHGRKPIWLAVGNAWTGLDVGGHKPWAELFGAELEPEQDNVLTTLIIPRLPFGTNKTITHMARMERNSTVPWEVLDVFFRTKQAMGRPVRRANLPKNRRIYILDGRLNDPEFGGYLSRIRALVKGYAGKVFFKK